MNPRNSRTRCAAGSLALSGRDSSGSWARPYPEIIAPTHYDVLGVDPNAEVDEIRSRYRALARELHPDHRAGSTDPAADRTMAAVNDAWATLGDSVRREQYDCYLAGDDLPAPPRETGSNVSPDLHVSPPMGCFVGVLGLLPVLGLLAIFALIFVFTAYAGSDRDNDDTVSTETTTMVAVRDLRGSCVQQVGGATVIVDCFTIPHEGVIVAQASRGAACPEGTVEWLIRQQDVLACTEVGSAVTAQP